MSEAAETEAPKATDESGDTSLFLVVIQSGLASTALTLLAVYLMRVYLQWHPMGFYANYVIPAGAMFVGFAASSGYGLSSWLTGTKISGRLLWIIVALQVGAYFLAQYIEFFSLGALYNRQTGQYISFFDYFHLQSISFAWVEHGKTGAPLGLWGYCFRALEVIGFAGGSLLAPAILWAVPYCESCQIYMKTRELRLIPASLPYKKLKKDDEKAAYQKEQEDFVKKSLESVERWKELASAGDAKGLQDALQAATSEKKSAVAKLPCRILVKLVHCKKCASGSVEFVLASGQGNEATAQSLAKIVLKPEAVEALRAFQAV